MPTSSQFKILRTIERLKSRKQIEVSPSATTSTYSFRDLDLQQVRKLGADGDGNLGTDDVPETATSRGSTKIHPDSTPDDYTEETKAEDDNKDEGADNLIRERRIAFSKVKDTDFATSKKLLYNLGFRGLPGDTAKEIDHTMMKKRPGLRTKSNFDTTMSVDDDGITPEMNKGLNTDILLDFSCLDQSTLRPTSICFDAKPGIDISHSDVWKELQKIMMDVPSLKIVTIEFNYRRIKSNKTEDDRWIINTDSPYSRNILAGREIRLGTTFRKETFLLRRYDDMLLLEFRKNARATAWENVLGTKAISGLSIEEPETRSTVKPRKKKGRKRKSKKKKDKLRNA